MEMLMGMPHSLLLTVVGPDRPGLVERLAGLIAAHDGNWLESRLVHLGGHFAGVVRVVVPPDRQPALRAALGALAGEGLAVTATDAAAAPSGPDRAVRLEVVGLDRPRIVSEIAAVVARHGLNVEEFTSEVTSAPMTAEPLFVARLKLAAPASADLAGLRGDLEKIAGELMVEVNLDDVAG
jgi:glycine cleavage system regulatory protein